MLKRRAERSPEHRVPEADAAVVAAGGDGPARRAPGRQANRALVLQAIPESVDKLAPGCEIGPDGGLERIVLIAGSLPVRSIDLARPQSTTSVSPNLPSITFEGFKSRCSTPRL